jgi:hypothetical protein
MQQMEREHATKSFITIAHTKNKFLITRAANIPCTILVGEHHNKALDRLSNVLHGDDFCFLDPFYNSAGLKHSPWNQLESGNNRIGCSLTFCKVSNTHRPLATLKLPTLSFHLLLQRIEEAS